jgi:hypothetical protein
MSAPRLGTLLAPHSGCRIIGTPGRYCPRASSAVFIQTQPERKSRDALKQRQLAPVPSVADKAIGRSAAVCGPAARRR